MMSLQKLRKKRNEINYVAAQHHAKNIRLFGSVLTGENNERSDVDFLVSFVAGASLLDQVALSEKLSEIIGVPVDVVSDRFIHKYLASKILQEAVQL